jgi:hypothetical protein
MEAVEERSISLPGMEPAKNTVEEVRPFSWKSRFILLECERVLGL